MQFCWPALNEAVAALLFYDFMTAAKKVPGKAIVDILPIMREI